MASVWLQSHFLHHLTVLLILSDLTLSPIILDHTYKSLAAISLPNRSPMSQWRSIAFHLIIGLRFGKDIMVFVVMYRQLQDPCNDRD